MAIAGPVAQSVEPAALFPVCRACPLVSIFINIRDADVIVAHQKVLGVLGPREIPFCSNIDFLSNSAHIRSSSVIVNESMTENENSHQFDIWHT